MNAKDRATKASLEDLDLFAGGVFFGEVPDNARFPCLALDVLRDRQVAALGAGQASTSVITYQLRAITNPGDPTAGDLAEQAADGVVAAPPVGAIGVVVPDTGLDRRRFVDSDGFYNAVCTVTIYF